MRTASKTLTFPLAGVSRRRGYRKQVRPYSAPWAVNVRGVCQIESRDRGGSRPGLTKVCTTDLGSNINAMIPVTSIDADGNRDYDIVIIADGSFYQLQGSTASSVSSRLEDDNGNPILTDDNEEILFDSSVSASSPVGETGAYCGAERNGKLYLADSVLKRYNPQTGVIENVTASNGAIPTEQPLVCVYRDRIILAGKDHVWYASRQSEPEDWNFGADMGDDGRAVAGQLAYTGGIGYTPQAIIPVEDKALVFACRNSIWVLYGDPATGRLRNLSSEIGIIAPNAWARSADGLMAFLSNDGIYVWQAGSEAAPKRFSEERIPGELRNVDTSNKISMAYDPRGRGFHLFITPESGDGSHWWLDTENKAIWPVSLQVSHQPVATARVEGTGIAEVLLGCNDGYLRKFNEDSATDDGTSIESDVLIGPFRIAPDDARDAMISEVHGIMADLPSGAIVTWRLFAGDSAEAVTDAAVADIKAATPCNYRASGQWTELRNYVVRPRIRGAWAAIWLSSMDKWAYEAVMIVSRQLGRLR